MSAVATALSRRNAGAGGWTLAAWLIALPVLAALAVIVASLLHPDTEIISHLGRYVLPRVALNTVLLVAGVTVLTAVMGAGLGWLTAMCDFPGRRFFSWALLLPMALPGYVIAFVAIGVLEYSGPVHTMLREWTGGSAWFPPIRSRGGIIIVMSLALYPYVYLLARNAFLTQGRRALEVGQTLGFSQWQSFFRVALPLARPWIAGGLMLVVMETLADFGTVSVFNYDTFTTAIYTSWFGLHSVPSALQLAFFLLLFVFTAVALEQRLRRGAAYTSNFVPAATGIMLGGWRKWAAFTMAAVVFATGFALPCLQLVIWTLQDVQVDGRFVVVALRTVTLATTAALLIASVSLLLAYAIRNAGRLARLAGRIATLGYALPGAVLAVGIYSKLAWLNGWMNSVLAAISDVPPRLYLQGTIVAMLLAYLVRFLAVAFQSVDAAMQRITPRMDESARLLGVAGWRLLRQVHVPLLRSGLLTAFILVFVDVLKEMPITLMTRPFGWDTFAVRVYEMTSEGMWQEAALPALAIALVGVVPVILVVKASAHAAATR